MYAKPPKPTGHPFAWVKLLPKLYMAVIQIGFFWFLISFVVLVLFGVDLWPYFLRQSPRSF